MTNTTQQFLEEYFSGRDQTKKDSIVLAVTTKAFKDLVDELNLRKTPEGMHIVDEADSVYVTGNENVIMVKTLFRGLHENFITLPAHVTHLVNQLFTNTDDFYFLYKKYDGSTFSKGTLKDPALLTAHTAAIQLARVNELTAEGLKRTVLGNNEVYLHMNTDHDDDIELVMTDCEDTDLPHLEISLEDEHDEDFVVARLNIEEVKRVQEATIKFLAKHTK